MFKVASEGCVASVEYFLVGETLAPYCQTLYNGYTVLDFVMFAAKKDVPRASDVLSYLRDSWSDIPTQGTGLDQANQAQHRGGAPRLPPDL